MRAKKIDLEDKILKKNPQILKLLLGQSNDQVHFSTGAVSYTHLTLPTIYSV